MHHQSEQLQLIIENTRDFAIVLFDTQRRITLWNVGAEQVLGWTETEIVGQLADVFFTPEDRQQGAPEQECEQAREEGRAEDERWHIRKDGSVFWGSGLVQPVYEAGQLCGYVKIFRDFTRHKEAEERLQLALDASALGTFVWYVQEDRAESDAQMLALFGLPDDSLLSLREALATLIHPDDRARYAQSVAQAIDPNGLGRHTAEIRVIHANGTERWLAITGQTVFGKDPPRPLHMNGIAADITERKRRDAHLAFLADLQTVLISFSSVEEIRKTAGKRIAEYLHLAHCLFVEIHQAAEIAEVIHDQNAAGFVSLVGFYHLAEFHTEAERRALAVGQTIRIPNVRDARTPEAAEGFEALGIHSLITAPYIRNGQWKFALSAQHAHSYAWRTDEAELLGELAERIYLRLERTRAEDALRRHQVEIEALNARLRRAMQETHHRVKNNLQVIVALVEMQGYDGAPLGEAGIRRINTHVRALATIHDLLTQQAKGDADLNDLNADAMLSRLIPILQSMAAGRHIRYEAEAVSLPVQQSAALALLVNELVSNAIKHGTGEIVITLQRDRQWVWLQVCDDGPGFPEGFDPREAAHTGLELIDSAARWDLKGKVAYENREEGGARIVITFPLDVETAK